MTTKRLQLTITYKTGLTLQSLVHYIHFEGDAIAFTVDKQVADAIQEQVKIKLANVERFEVTQVACEGWKVIE